MSPSVLFIFVLAYFSVLLGVAWVTSRNANNDTFFIGNKSSNWMLVAFGMIGTSLSGVTFISVPGAVAHDGFTYFQIVLGQFLGYMVIAFVLLPLYYRDGLTSIYRYLDTRLGRRTYLTGAAFFILSRTLGATARLYIVVRILQDAILDGLGIPFWLTTLVILVMILLYTYQGGVKTIVWTDTLQTVCMLGGLVICVMYVLSALSWSAVDGVAHLQATGLARVFSFDVDSRLFFVKQIVAGMFIAIAMTGLDQEMMQKTISVRTLRDSQKNIVVLSVIMLVVVLLFLFLGGLLALYAPTVGVAATGDALFPAVVLGHLPAFVQVIFVIALISALFPSADGAITALTSSFCIDILGLQRRFDMTETRRTRWRHIVHLSFALIFLLLILVFKFVDSASMIGVILKLAGYTYGPLMGLFAFGILTRRTVRDTFVPLVALGAPVLCFLIDVNQAALFGSYQIGLELLVLNAAFVFFGLWVISSASSEVAGD
jgi:Na+/proline symporter